MGVDAFVQVSPDSSGKKIRNVETVIVLADGSQHTVEAQVVVQMGPDGRIVDPSTDRVLYLLESINSHLEDMLHELREMGEHDLKQATAKDGERFFSTSSKDKI